MIMSGKEIDNQNATKRELDNKQCVHNAQLHTSKYIEHISNKPTTTSIRYRQVCGCILAIEFSRRREGEPSASRKFIRLIVLDYKSARQSRQQSVVIQKTLCKVACGLPHRSLYRFSGQELVIRNRSWSL